MSNLVDKEKELQAMTCLDALLDRANHDEYLGRIGKKEALKFLEENRQYVEIIKLRLRRLEAIDNAKPSEALECLENLFSNVVSTTYNRESSLKDFNVIKQALLKAQEPKQYLKWEDLEFDNNASVKKHLKVKLGDNIYKAYYHYCFILNSELFCIENDNENLNIYITNRQFFNDLYLERVEE